MRPRRSKTPVTATPTTTDCTNHSLITTSKPGNMDSAHQRETIVWHLYLILLIASCASFFLALIESYTRKPLARVNWLALGALLFVLYFTIMLART